MPGRARSGLPAWRPAAALAWPAVLAIWIYAWFGRLGFYPTDEGLLQSYTYRILLGQVPHRDFISPRPIGSAVLHLLDFAIPGPLFEVGRALALCEYTAAAILLAWLVRGVAPWRWEWATALGATGAVLVNMNIFPLMSWYTVDGILLVAAGLVAVQAGVRSHRPWVFILGFAALGAAATTKQSFVPAPLLGWLLLLPWLRSRGSWPARTRWLAITGVVAGLPGVALLTAIFLLGGAGAMVTQLTSGSLVYGRPLVDVWSAHTVLVAVPVALEVALLTLLHASLPRRSAVLSVGAQVGLSVIAIAVPLLAGLGTREPAWGLATTWMAIVMVGATSLRARSIDVPGVALVGLAWMSMLSWGYPLPNLVGGSLLFYVLARTWTSVPGAPGRTRLTRGALATGALAVLVVVGQQFALARSTVVYGDLSAPQLVSNLGDVAPAWGGIRTGPRTFEYIDQVASCSRRYPASREAVLPQNAGIYPALSLRNPFPIDWMFPDDYHGSYDRLLQTADRLNREGDYLVLFETVAPPFYNPNIPPPTTESTELWHYDDPHQVPTEIYARLTGRHAICGRFKVIYAPRP